MPDVVQHSAPPRRMTLYFCPQCRDLDFVRRCIGDMDEGAKVAHAGLDRWPVFYEQAKTGARPSDDAVGARSPNYDSTSWYSTGTGTGVEDSRDALVDRIAKTQADTHGVPEAWASFIPEADAIVTALFGCPCVGTPDQDECPHA